MKRFLLAAFVSLAAAFPVAFAQDADPFIGGGFGISFVGGGSLTAITLQGGADNLIGSASLRGNFDIGISPDSFFGFGVDILADFPSDELTPYIGGGVGLISAGASIFDIHGTGGLEFFLADQAALFAELQPKLYIVDGITFGATLRLGFNYHLD